MDWCENPACQKPLCGEVWEDIPSEEIKQIFRPLLGSTERPVEMVVSARYKRGSAML